MPKQGITAILVDFKDTQRFAFMTFLAIVVYLLFCTQPAEAAAIAAVLCSVINAILIDVGRGIATLAVIVLGISALLGKATWAQGLVVLTGIAIIFGAPAIALGLFTAALTGSDLLGTAVGQAGGIGSIIAVAGCNVGIR